MRKQSASSLRHRIFAFLTLKEVIVIIFILGCVFQLGLIMLTRQGKGVATTQKRARGTEQIMALTTALEQYKVDNGTYPVVLSGTMPDPTTQGDPKAYRDSARFLFSSLAGRANYGSAHISGIRQYYLFKRNEISGLTETIAADPWRNPIGYNAQKPHYHPDFFDLWSTAGYKSLTDQNHWITNFK